MCVFESIDAGIQISTQGWLGGFLHPPLRPQFFRVTPLHFEEIVDYTFTNFEKFDGRASKPEIASHDIFISYVSIFSMKIRKMCYMREKIHIHEIFLSFSVNYMNFL